MTKSQQIIAAAVAAITEAGFVSDGETQSATVRIPTVRVPVFGGIGGELATFGGRLRFAKPGTARKVTVGARSVCFYDKLSADDAKKRASSGTTMLSSSVANSVTVDTKDIERIRALAGAP